MENIRRKYNPMVHLSKFTFNKKNIKWSCSLNLQPRLLTNFVESLFMLGLEKFREVSNFFKGKKNHKFFLNLYIIIFFSRSGWSCEHPGINVEPRPCSSIGVHMDSSEYPVHGSLT